MTRLIVERVGPMVTVQDHGRRGFAHVGVPPSGPLDDETMQRALAAVGAIGRACLEIPLSSARFRLEGEALVSVDGEPPRLVRDDVLDVPSHARAVRYLAIRGGVEVPEVMAARATLVPAHIGGFEGRPLRSGDVLAIGDGGEPPRIGRSTPALDDDALPFEPTFDADPALVDALVDAGFLVDPRSDRVGVRLSGDALEAPPAVALSRPIAPGAIQLPPNGLPIVIGPDGPTTGGYVVIGVLGRDARSRLARRRPGARVRFCRAG